VTDGGSGQTEDFDIDETQSLGLSIVRDLVWNQFDGAITMCDEHDRDPERTGTVVSIELPVRGRQRASLVVTRGQGCRGQTERVGHAC